MRSSRLAILVALAGLLVYAMRTHRAPQPLYKLAPPNGADELAAEHDSSKCGSIAGRVNWVGPIPDVKPLEFNSSPLLLKEVRIVPNPNAPAIAEGGVANAVVFLRDVNVRRSKPWDRGGVAIEYHSNELVQRIGVERVPIAIVRQGEGVELRTRSAGANSVRGRGAAFFTQMLVDPGRPVVRKLTEPGVVELSSGSGHFWLRSYLFVANHPYVEIANSRGEFRLTNVPAGEYEVVCWKPNWHIARIDRDPELAVKTRLEFGPAVEKTLRVRVTAGGEVRAEFSLETKDFQK